MDWVDRTHQKQLFHQYILDIYKNITNNTAKRAIYIYGNSGVGKSWFVETMLKEMDICMLKYDACDVRNKNMIIDISNKSISNANVLSLMEGKRQKITVVMDELDNMKISSSDKGGLERLIKMIKPKRATKTKKANVPSKKRASKTAIDDDNLQTSAPIVCIGGNKQDKKTKELIKICHTIELPTPTRLQMQQLIIHFFKECNNPLIINRLIDYIDGNLNRFQVVKEMYSMNSDKWNNQEYIFEMFQPYANNYTERAIITNLLQTPHSFVEHQFLNKNMRTKLGLFWHENIIDYVKQPNKTHNDRIDFYLEQLNNCKKADIIDRYTFQNQMWLFGEMSSLIKTYLNHSLFHEYSTKIPKVKTDDIRFTKILTKYTTGYNHQLFVQHISQLLNVDYPDIYGLWYDIRLKNTDVKELSLLIDLSETDILRLDRYMDKYLSENAKRIEDEDCEDDTIEE